MIYLFSGSDIEKTRTKAFAWVAASRKKAPEVSYVRLGADAISEMSLQEVASTSGLFFTKSLVLLDDPFSLKDSGDAVLDALKMLAESPNPIAILAPKLPAAPAKKIEAKAEKVFKTDVTEKKVSRGFNSGLVNALGAKDGRALWEEIAKANRLGDAPEMLHGLLHWKARDMMTKGSRSWTRAEARTLSLDLIELLSESRAQSLDLGIALERWALSLTR